MSGDFRNFGFRFAVRRNLTSSTTKTKTLVTQRYETITCNGSITLSAGFQPSAEANHFRPYHLNYCEFPFQSPCHRESCGCLLSKHALPNYLSPAETNSVRRLTQTHPFSSPVGPTDTISNQTQPNDQMSTQSSPSAETHRRTERAPALSSERRIAARAAAAAVAMLHHIHRSPRLVTLSSAKAITVRSAYTRQTAAATLKWPTHACSRSRQRWVRDGGRGTGDGGRGTGDGERREGGREGEEREREREIEREEGGGGRVRGW